MYQQIRNILSSTNSLPEEINDIIMSYVGTPETVTFDYQLIDFRKDYQQLINIEDHDIYYTTYTIICKKYRKPFLLQLADYLGIYNFNSLEYQGRSVNTTNSKVELLVLIIDIIRNVLFDKIEPVNNIASRMIYRDVDIFKSLNKDHQHAIYHLWTIYKTNDFKRLCRFLKIKYGKHTAKHTLCKRVVYRIYKNEDATINKYNDVIQQIYLKKIIQQLKN